MFNLCIYCL